MPVRTAIAVVSLHPSTVRRGEQIARKLSLPFHGLADPPSLSAGLWLLLVSETGLAIQQGGPRVAGPVAVDFVGGKMGFRRRRQEATPAIVRAVGRRSGVHPRVWDLTAGLGQDAFVLANHGCVVTMFERNPVVHCLLADGLVRARRFAAQDDAGEEETGLLEVLGRLELREADSIEVLSGLDTENQPEVIYIDTMFPARSKSAKVKKNMQLFQQVVGEDCDAEYLLELALQCAWNRVVVKRPRHAEALLPLKPTFDFSGKSIRFDVYTIKAMGRSS